MKPYNNKHFLKIVLTALLTCLSIAALLIVGLLTGCRTASKTTTTKTNTVTTYRDTTVSIPKDSIKSVREIVFKQDSATGKVTINLKPDTITKGNIQLITKVVNNKLITVAKINPNATITIKAANKETVTVKTTEIVKVLKPTFWQKIKYAIYMLVSVSVLYAAIMLIYNVFKTKY